MPMDYKKLKANSDASIISTWIGPSGGTTLGVTEVGEPLAAELNNTGGTSGMILANKAISWDDWDFGVQESDTNNQPSMADTSTYEEFGQYNFGGGISFFQPDGNEEDTSNTLWNVKELTKVDLDQDIAIRIDGNKPYTQPAADGDYASVYRVSAVAVANPFAPGEAKRRTVTFSSQEEFAHYTVVGEHVLTPVLPATAPWAAGKKARVRIEVQGRDFTNSDALRYRTSDETVVEVYPGGFYEVTGAADDTATITVEDTGAGTSVEIEVTVTAP